MRRRVLAHLVGRNEADRYLQAVLQALPTSDVHFYDDGSTDATAEVARTEGCLVTSRAPDVPTFLEDEGAFRQAAWRAFEIQMAPREGDWVLALDCDEMPLAVDGDVEGSMHRAIKEAGSCQGIDVPIPEVWEIRGDELWVRTDLFWGGLSAPRLFRYTGGGSFAARSMGCGSVPLYVTQSPFARGNSGFSLGHLGYADPDDRRAKHERYTGMGDHGHNPAHIASILSRPTLARLEVASPPIWRGIR